MAFTFSNSFPMGKSAPEFKLPNVVTGEVNTLSQLQGKKATVIMFICNHCPYVIHVKHMLTKVAKEFDPKEVSFVAISANDVDAYPQDHPDLMKKDAISYNYPFPYLYDESQETAKAYRAACTPDFYVFDGDLKCTYHGCLDESSPKNQKPVNGSELRGAILKSIQGIPIPLKDQKPSSGCNIKWKSGINPF